MHFYNRNTEIEELQRIQRLSFERHSRMTVITGRRRIGKTSLAIKATKGDIPTLYLFISRKNEATLCAELLPLVTSTLNTYIPESINNFRSLFHQLMEMGKHRKFNLIIDEFQEFNNINPSVFSDIQNIWDQYRQETHVNLVLMGSVFSMMHRIFENNKEPLFGRADNIIRLHGFSTATLKEIVSDHNPNYTPDDLLALYTISGGVPKYVELLCENTDLTVKGMFDYVIRDNSPFTDEGKNLLIEEFGKDYGVYFSILSAIASGKNTQPEIEASLGGKSVGGQLRRLIEDYSVIVRRRPILAKERSQAVRYEISDNFLRFWFNYFDRNQTIIELRNFTVLREIVEANYPTYSGTMLERYFRQKMAESQQYVNIGAWWEHSGNENEIDIVALKADKKQAVAVEVKRNKKNFKPEKMAQKVSHLHDKILPGYTITTLCLTLEDM